MFIFCLAKNYHFEEVTYVTIIRKIINDKRVKIKQAARSSNYAMGTTTRKSWFASCQRQRLFCSVLHINRPCCLTRFLCNGFQLHFTGVQSSQSMKQATRPHQAHSVRYQRAIHPLPRIVTESDVSLSTRTVLPYLHVSAFTHTVFY